MPDATNNLNPHTIVRIGLLSSDLPLASAPAYWPLPETDAPVTPPAATYATTPTAAIPSLCTAADMCVSDPTAPAEGTMPRTHPGDRNGTGSTSPLSCALPHEDPHDCLTQNIAIDHLALSVQTDLHKNNPLFLSQPPSLGRSSPAESAAILLHSDSNKFR